MNLLATHFRLAALVAWMVAILDPTFNAIDVDPKKVLKCVKLPAQRPTR
jgi:hypothetical protein